MKYIVLLQKHYIRHTEVIAWSDCDGVLRVFSTREQAEESARKNPAAKVNGCQIVPFGSEPTAWVYP